MLPCVLKNILYLSISLTQPEKVLFLWKLMAWGQLKSHCYKLSGLNNHSSKNSASAGLCGGSNRPGETDCRKHVVHPSWTTNYLTVVYPGESAHVNSCLYNLRPDSCCVISPLSALLLLLQALMLLLIYPTTQILENILLFTRKINDPIFFSAKTEWGAQQLILRYYL